MTEQAQSQGRMAFYVDETMHTPNGYVPVVVFENEPGYTPMMGQGELSQPWYWGHDIVTAKRLAAEANERMGLSEADAREIVVSSMRVQATEEARREAAEQRWDRIKRGLPADPYPWER